MQTRPTTPPRPGCVTLYALFLGLSSVGLAVMAVMDLLNTRRAWADRHAVVIVSALALGHGTGDPGAAGAR